MDFVPKHERGRWKSLESVAKFGWCGSAMLGGYLVDRYDYPFTFLLTAMIQAAAVAIWTVLLCIVPRREATGPAAQAQGGDCSQQAEIRTSLLHGRGEENENGEDSN